MYSTVCVSGKSDAIMTRAHVRENVIRRSSYSVQVMSHASSLETDSLNLLCGNRWVFMLPLISLLLTHFVIASLTLGSSPSSARLVIMAEPLPVPKQLATQLAKCKSIRDSNYYKSRDKSPEVRKRNLRIFRRFVILYFCHLTSPSFLSTGNQSSQG
jgi:hypothetical protein